MKLKPIDRQVAVVVGASSGIGRDTALELARRGAKVVVASRNRQALHGLVEEIRRMDREAIAVAADVAHLDQVEAIAERAVATFGRIDTWVHCAAAGLIATFESTTPEEFRRVIDVVLMGQVYGAKVALPHLERAGGGSFIAVSSVVGLRGIPLQSAYSAAKHGLEGFLEAVRIELRHEGKGINIVSIKPSAIDTPFYRHALTKIGVRPAAVPPVYHPRLVTRAILAAAERPTRDFIVGDLGRVLRTLQHISPALTDLFAAAIAFRWQRSSEPKGPRDPHNLFEPIAEPGRITGDLGQLELPSVSDWVAHRSLKAAGVVALGLVAVLALLAI